MLKIKDNVDLKELEKFGFELSNGVQYIKKRYIDEILAYLIYITPTHHYIQIRIYDAGIIAGSLQATLYDLIKADLVERV